MDEFDDCEDKDPSDDNTGLAEIEVLFCEIAEVIAPIGECGDNPRRPGTVGLYADGGGPSKYCAEYESTVPYAERYSPLWLPLRECGGKSECGSLCATKRKALIGDGRATRESEITYPYIAEE